MAKQSENQYNLYFFLALYDFKECFLKIEKEHSDLFESFVNFLINDMHFLIDEAFEKLKLIKEFQNLQGNPEEWNKIPLDEKERKENEINETKRAVKSFLSVTLCFY